MTWRTIGSLRESPFARLDFRSKLMVMFVATFLAFLWESPALTGALALLTLILCLVAGIRLSYVGRLLRIMLPFYVILLITHGIWNSSVGRTVIWGAPETWWLIGGTLQVTAEGLAYGFMVIFRTLTLMLVIPLVIFTTDLNELIVGLVRIRIPYKIAFAFSATLRFVPLLWADIETITEAQRLRGLALEKMNLLQRLRVYSQIAVPLILGAMTRSQQIDVVLASKAFSGSPDRTYLHESSLRTVDCVVLVLCLGVLIAAVVLRAATGLGRFGLPGL
jgi:energy-coupling factor transport system permease protein